MHKKNKLHCSKLCDHFCFRELIDDNLSVPDHDFRADVDFPARVFQLISNYCLHLLICQIHDNSFCYLNHHFNLIMIFVCEFRTKFCISMFFNDIQGHFFSVINNAVAFVCMVNIKEVILNVSQNIEKIENCLIFFHEIDKGRDRFNFFINNGLQRSQKLIVDRFFFFGRPIENETIPKVSKHDDSEAGI